MKVIFIDEFGKSEVRRDCHFLDVSTVMNDDSRIAHSGVIVDIDEAENVAETDK